MAIDVETPPPAIGSDEVRQAVERLRPWVHRTPVLQSKTLNARSGGTVLLKCENFQRVGAFKFRGAMNALLQLSDAERAAGVVTHSSGNHAQAVALAGQLAWHSGLRRDAPHGPAGEARGDRGVRCAGRPLRADARGARVDRRRTDRAPWAVLDPSVRRLAGDRRPGDGRLGADRRGRALRPDPDARSAAAACSPGPR